MDHHDRYARRNGTQNSLRTVNANVDTVNASTSTSTSRTDGHSMTSSKSSHPFRSVMNATRSPLEEFTASDPKYNSQEEIPQILTEHDADGFNISIVVQLSGELGNHLSKVAFGYAIQQLLMERHAIRSHLVLQHQERVTKWKTARRDLQQCFPFFRGADFELGNSPEFFSLQARQQEADHYDHRHFVFPQHTTMDEIDFKLNVVAQILKKTNKDGYQNNQPSNTTVTAGIHIFDKNGNITLPFLHVQDFAAFPLLDLYYNELRELFAFDRDACCSQLPYDDEAVFVSKSTSEQCVYTLKSDLCCELNDPFSLSFSNINALPLYSTFAISLEKCLARGNKWASKN
jgi:hypothetical protein